MSIINQYMYLGICPTMLCPESNDNKFEHLKAIQLGCELHEFDALDLNLSDDDEIRQEEIRLLNQSGKVINYASPVQLQQDGEYNPGSKDEKVRARAIDYFKKHIDYAAAVGAKKFIMAPCPNCAHRHDAVKALYTEFLLTMAKHASRLGIDIVFEPAERVKFRKLVFGPTKEAVDFVHNINEVGVNIKLMIDFGHLPLMEEDYADALKKSMDAELKHIHLGNAVLDPTSEFYGHTHPPIGIEGGVYDFKEVTDQFVQLLSVGYISAKHCGLKPTVSLEMKPYPGVSAATSARFAYEKVSKAFQIAIEEYNE